MCSAETVSLGAAESDMRSENLYTVFLTTGEHTFAVERWREGRALVHSGLAFDELKGKRLKVARGVTVPSH